MSAAATEDFDYVIVGAGSAGSVLAGRLSEAGHTVCVLEAGQARQPLIVRMPAALAYPMHSPRLDWGLWTEPEPHLGNRKVHLPRGKGLGGSSAINGMCYVRGNPMDYDSWAALGADGWDWPSVYPYFLRLENFEPGGAFRGRSGPMAVRRGAMTNPLCDAFLRSAREAGFELTDDMNGARHEGFGPMDMTVCGGERASAARMYLLPAMQSGRVKVVTGALVQTVEILDSRARAVAYHAGGALRRVSARAAVILSAGAIMSPTILKRSGIGPGAELSGHGIRTLVDLPSVGENLCDHMEMYIQQSCRVPVSLYAMMPLWRRAMVGLAWMLFRRGPGATNHFESGGHVRSRAGIPYPDIQFHFLPIAISYNGKEMAGEHGYQVHVGTKRSKSRGWVRLASASADVLPRVRFNYMSHPDDWTEMRSCIRIAREIFAQPSFDPYRGRELAPGDHVTSEADLDAFIRDKAESAYHPCGTCRMGSDAEAAVSPDLKVKGVEGLYVADASVMPHATAGDLNAPTLALAERAADLILGRPPLRDDSAPRWRDSGWQERDRPGVPMRPMVVLE